MSDQPNKALAPAADPLPKAGFAAPPAPSPPAGVSPPLPAGAGGASGAPELTPEGVGSSPLVANDQPVECPASRQRETGRVRGKRKRKRDWKERLYQYRLKTDRKTRRKFWAHWKTDPKETRAILKKADGKVFRLKPGPKPDLQKNALIVRAAAERAAGAQPEELCAKYIEGRARMTEYTRHYADAGFMKEVSKELRLQRKSSKKILTTKCTP